MFNFVKFIVDFNRFVFLIVLEFNNIVSMFFIVNCSKTREIMSVFLKKKIVLF